MKLYKKAKMSLSRQSSRTSVGASSNAGDTADIFENANNDFRNIPTSPDDSYQKRFTYAHPLGNLLVRLVTTNTELCKKSNLKTPDTPDLQELCEKFHEAITLERDKVSKEVAKASVDVEDIILNKELNFDSLNAPIKPPENFSPIPVITTASKMAEVLKSFPTKNNQKFNGNKGSSVLEFLNAMNTGQQITNLSKKEFLQIMLKCVSGRVYSMISECVGHNHEIPDVYFSLVTLYDDRITSANARQVLMTYRVPKNSTLTKAQSYILELASRVASQLPEGKSRTSMFNIEANNALIRCLPDYSTTLATNVLNTLSAKLARNPSFIELTKALTKYRDSINLDIAKNGALLNRIMNFKNKFTPRNDRRIYSVNKTPARKYANNNRYRGNNRYNTRRYQNRQNKPEPQRRFNRANINNVNAQNNRSGGQAKDRAYNMNQGQQNKGNKIGRGTYCSLCGGTNHTSAQICYKMRDPVSNRVVECVPTYQHCKICYEKIGKRLYHPMNLCFNKDKKSEESKV